MGVVDPSHTTRKKTGAVGSKPPWLSLADALDKAEHEGLRYAPWTWELMNAMFSEHQERNNLISSSALVSACPRSEVLKRREDYVEELESMYIPFRGTMVHRTMELYAHPGALAEFRFWATFNGGEVSCSPDHLSVDTLLDYKFTETPPAYNYPYVHHKEQVQLNAYITRNATMWQAPGGGSRFEDFSSLAFDPRENPVEHLGLVYMGPKFVKVLEVETTDNNTFNPKTGKWGKFTGPDIWSDEKVEKLFGPRYEALKAALDNYPTFPKGAAKVWGGDETWACPGPPLCKLPNCLAKRYAGGNLTWDF